MRLETVAIDEMLYSPGGCDVLLLVMFDQLECGTELGVQTIRIVLNHGEAAAFGRPIGSECGDDNVSARLHGSHHLLDVSAAISFTGQKMEDSAIVPNVKSPFGQWD